MANEKLEVLHGDESGFPSMVNIEPIAVKEWESETEEEEKVIIAPRGTIFNSRYLPPEIDRDAYIYSRNVEARTTKYVYYKKMDNKQIVHLNRTDSLNFYPEDMIEVMTLFLNYYGEGTLYVINGFRSAKQIGINAHSVGLAMDIQANDRAHALKIANTAYFAGMKNIVFGGDFTIGQGYVHLDITPFEEFAYDAGYYGGPWS